MPFSLSIVGLCLTPHIASAFLYLLVKNIFIAKTSSCNFRKLSPCCSQGNFFIESSRLLIDFSKPPILFPILYKPEKIPTAARTEITDNTISNVVIILFINSTAKIQKNILHRAKFLKNFYLKYEYFHYQTIRFPQKVFPIVLSSKKTTRNRFILLNIKGKWENFIDPVRAEGSGDFDVVVGETEHLAISFLRLPQDWASLAGMLVVEKSFLSFRKLQ